MNLMQEAEHLKDVVGTFDHGQYQLRPALIIKLGISESDYKRLSQDLHAVLIDKGAGDFIMTCINEDRDGFYVYKQVHRLFKETSGLGTLERRNYILKP